MRKIGFLVFLLCVVGASACSARRESPAKVGAPGAGEANTVRADLGRAAKRDFYVYHNDIFPGFLLHTRRNELHFFRGLDQVGLSAPTHMAWSENGSVRVAKTPVKTAARLSAPWVLVWFNGAKGWDATRYLPVDEDSRSDPAVGPIDVPWLIILQKPAALSLSAQGLSLTGQAPLGHVVFMPLFGSQKLRPSDTAGWASGLPKAVVERARRWTAISRRFPLYVKEDYQVDEARDAVRIRNTFDYLTIDDHWKTAGTTLAPLPPVVALAYTSKFRIAFDAPPVDLKTVTHWGPYWGVEGKAGYTYTVQGILKYIDEVELVKGLKRSTPGFDAAEGQLLHRMGEAAKGGADPRQAYSIDWGMGMLGAWMRSMKHLPPDLRKQLTDYIRRENLLDGYFLNPATYEGHSVPVSPEREIRVLAVKPREGRQTYGDDLVKQTSRMPYVVWQYGYYGGDWKTVRQRYDLVKKMYGFNLLLGWSNVGPEYTAEHAKISAKQGPIGLARLAKQFGDQATYDYGAYLLAKALINEWTWDVAAIPYMKKHAPWFHDTRGDWIMHQNHGYGGLSGLPLDRITAYREIPLVLDRFNREELWSYNDHYVRMRHKYVPREDTANVYVTDLGDASDLKALLSKPLTELVDAMNDQSHLTPVFYNYPIDLMELTAEFSYKRLYPRGKAAPAWRRGLDALSRGQSWRQMVMAMRKDPGSWPYPGWYQMNPPQTGETFSNDLLPFGYIQADLRRSPRGARFEVRSNWNSDLVAVDLEAAKPAPRSSRGRTAYLSDLDWVSETNGWGPAERDRSIGGLKAGDGRPLTLNGKTYAKGLSAHAPSEIVFDLGGTYATFRADIGLDDEVGSQGSVVFQVWADGQKLYDSGVMTGDTPAKAVSVRVAGKKELRLVVTDAGDGKGFDVADWAGAQLAR